MKGFEDDELALAPIADLLGEELDELCVSVKAGKL